MEFHNLSCGCASGIDKGQINVYMRRRLYIITFLMHVTLQCGGSLEVAMNVPAPLATTEIIVSLQLILAVMGVMLA